MTTLVRDGEQKANYNMMILHVAAPLGVTHTVSVQAESLFEAVALAVAEFRQDKLVLALPRLPNSPFAIERAPVEHRILFSKVIQWAESNTTREGPAGLLKRARIKDSPPGQVINEPELCTYLRAHVLLDS